jgi:membrane fusion protein (multidrug efflux system)
MSQTNVSPETPRSNLRRNAFMALGAAVLLAAIAYGVWWYLGARYFENTDDAYVGGNIVAVTSRETSTVIALHADNTQTVARGQVLVELDSASVDVAFEAAKANLARVVRQVRGAFSGSDTYAAQVAQARVQLAAAETDLQRRQGAPEGVVSGEELQHARDQVKAAQAALATAQSGAATSRATIAGTDIARNPDVLAAEAALRNAAIAESHMKIVAPVDGVVAQRTVQIGQQVQAGAPVMSVVPLEAVWIDANFKEVQLARMRIGQPVEVTADIYGGDVVYHGRVEGLGAGSGSAFALLPPQNASGNWIKIVQRLPVRIALDPRELQAHPLRVGLSVDAKVDVHDTSGPVVTTRVGAGSITAAAGDGDKAAVDALIAQIVRANSGGH